MYRLNNLKVPLGADLQQIFQEAEKLCHNAKICDLKVAKKSVDARNKNNIHFVYSVDFNSDEKLQNLPNLEELKPAEKLVFNIKACATRPIVVGSGPAGMFAGLALGLAGLRPIILERGADLDTRINKVNNFWQHGILDTQSNVQFGEGGAGTFSDGKLMSGIKRDKFTDMVMHEFVQAGAPSEILYLAKPHIGTDKLRDVVKNIRNKIINLGGEYRFNSKLSDIIIQNETLKAVKITTLDQEYELEAEKLFLAIGHSARDTFEMLQKRGVFMQQKPFSVGLRIEHKQQDLNIAQYGKQHNNPHLPAADYKLAVHLPNNRSVYTFCMCPGGTVVAAASESKRLVTNGMSEFARNKKNANAALLVGVDKRDFGSSEPLAGMYFQRELEEKAFILGGGNYRAPAQMVGDFLHNKASSKIGNIKPSYLPGVTLCDLSGIFSQEICESLKSGIVQMGKKLSIFQNPTAILTGVETRSSSPVRIVRDNSMQSNIRGIYPCGEGAGYAGGITSAATDGLRAVYTLCEDK